MFIVHRCDTERSTVFIVYLLSVWLVVWCVVTTSLACTFSEIGLLVYRRLRYCVTFSSPSILLQQLVIIYMHVSIACLVEVCYIFHSLMVDSEKNDIYTSITQGHCHWLSLELHAIHEVHKVHKLSAEGYIPSDKHVAKSAASCEYVCDMFV